MPIRLCLGRLGVRWPDAELPALLIRRVARRDRRGWRYRVAARLPGKFPPGSTSPGLAPGAPRDAGQWGYEGHFRGPVRLAASGLGYVAAMRIRGRRGGLFVVVDLGGLVMGSWDTPVAGLGWLKAGAIGQFGLVIVAAAVLIAGAARPSWRRGAAIAAYAIIALEIGWFLLTRMLVQDHP